MYQVFRKVVGIASENTYVIVNERNEALIVDPGAQAEMLIKWIEDNQWQPQAVLLTHGHFDHIGALDAVRQHFNVEAYIHQIEADFLVNPVLNLSAGMLNQEVRQQPAQHLWNNTGLQKIGAFEFRIELIPGHSPGHVVYIFEQASFVIAGDTLFNGSIGRTDFYLGSLSTLLSGIRTHLMCLTDDFMVYPGHGEATTIGKERLSNLYL
ncbi:MULTISPECIES: MBL fold metallo-hydrolase [unclassified Facklamia]|uniref:MBL fold metallo-hydrolase n=1 Tax=Aerococcaceae TaxID=186827 RepID=UPI0013B646F0|nr:MULTISPECIES: MBL fold metallo-hydrolase [unclassified Facklamia]MBS4461729.1 MBL fold metallo-hydrolase [Aerococcaceae bacterium zg-B36]NEW64017.1 MBL fold metallo-hydrolase [Facklamia sp. 252]NEW67488.1 MBL fold metallo-hydrolase [Facklamia sp. 253]QQD65361.1 MBL fold metallo-hydrolase [Aerococcaceae bacterium zg-252]